MKKVEPSIFLVAATELDHDNTAKWLESIGGAKVLDHLTGDPGEQLVELAGRSCYMSFDLGLNPNVSKIRTDSEEYHHNILESEHGSVLHHATCTFTFEGVTRVFTHEVVRNSIGTAFSQRSLRYVRLGEIPFVFPDIITDNPEALQVFEEVIEKCEWGQKELARIFNIANMKSFKDKKLLTSAFRRIAPMGVATGIMITFNVRALRWVIQQRTSEHAEWEIRKVFGQVYHLAKAKYPFLFQDFVTRDTGDGLFEAIPEYKKV